MQQVEKDIFAGRLSQGSLERGDRKEDQQTTGAAHT
jgi:hypothetical protein